MRLVLPVLLLLALMGCSGHRMHLRAQAVPVVVATTSTSLRVTTTQRASRSQPIRLQSRGVVASVPSAMSDSFWRRLANCESSDGRSGAHLGFFQFSRDTARKVGYFAGATYEQQREMAKRWLSMIGGPARGGTRSGWPHCWWVALRGGT